jgi:hypothetical protein
MLDGADCAAQFGKAAQPADNGIAGIGPFRFSEIVEHSVALVGPEHNLVAGRTTPVFREQRLQDRHHVDVTIKMKGLEEPQAVGIPQIAMDGSQKLPQRLLGATGDRLALGLPIETHALAVAGWMCYVTATDEQGREIDVRDSIATELAASRPRPARSLTGWLPRCWTSARCSARLGPIRACARRSPKGSHSSAIWVHAGRCRHALRKTRSTCVVKAPMKAIQ